MGMGMSVGRMQRVSSDIILVSLFAFVVDVAVVVAVMSTASFILTWLVQFSGRLLNFLHVFHI